MATARALQRRTDTPQSARFARSSPTPVEAPAPVEQLAVPARPAIESAAAPVPLVEGQAVSEVAHEAAAPEQAAPALSTTPRQNQFLVNLNQCSAEELAKIDGVGPVLAQRIIEFRKRAVTNLGG